MMMMNCNLRRIFLLKILKNFSFTESSSVLKACNKNEATASGCFLLLLLAYLSSYHEKATKRCTSSLRSCRPFVDHTKMGEFRHMPFPTAQVNLPAFSTLSLKC